MSLTLIIILVTVVISIAAFNNESLFNKLILWPRKMDDPSQYYRLLTSGFVHANYNHLIFNMLSLFFFGITAEASFSTPPVYMFMYLSAIIVSSLPSYIKNRNNAYYRSLGASGGVAAVLFATVYFNPWSKIYFFFIPIGIPSILFAVLYLVYSAYMARRGGTGVNHDAHFWGSLYGFLFAAIANFSDFPYFLQRLTHPSY